MLLSMGFLDLVENMVSRFNDEMSYSSSLYDEVVESRGGGGY